MHTRRDREPSSQGTMLMEVPSTAIAASSSSFSTKEEDEVEVDELQSPSMEHELVHEGDKSPPAAAPPPPQAAPNDSTNKELSNGDSKSSQHLNGAAAADKMGGVIHSNPNTR